MWLDESVFYQIYPIGFCGAPRTALEEGQLSCNRIGKVIDWIDHIKRLGCNAVYFPRCLNRTVTAMIPAIFA